MDEDGNLYFSYLKLSDHQSGKLYKCFSFNAFLNVHTGGCYSVVNVHPDGLENAVPLVAYQTPTPIGLVGDSITLKCLFSGYPVHNISWKRRDGKALPIGRHDYPDNSVKSSSELFLTDLDYDDEGEYVKSVNSQTRWRCQRGEGEENWNKKR
jgi:hypothetical protein